MSRELWNKTINGIDSKYAEEAGEYFARHGRERIPEDKEVDGGTAIQIKPQQAAPKKWRGAAIFGGCAAAVAVTAGILFGVRGALPQITNSGVSNNDSETSQTHSETAETDEIRGEMTVIVETAEPEADVEGIDEVRITELPQRPITDCGISHIGFEKPEFAEIALEADGGEIRSSPVYVLYDENGDYGVYGIEKGSGYEKLVVSHQWVGAKSTVFFENLGEFYFTGDEFTVKDIILTEDYILLYYKTTATKLLDFALMSRETGTVTQDIHLSSWAADKDYQPLGGISHNGGNVVSWYRRGSTIQTYDITSGDSSSLKNPNMLTQYYADRDCYFIMNEDKDVFLKNERVTGGSMYIGRYSSMPILRLFRDDIAVWVDNTTIYATDLRKGIIYTDYYGGGLEDYDIGVKDKMLYIKDDKQHLLQLCDLFSGVRYVHDYYVPLNEWTRPAHYEGHGEVEIAFTKSMSSEAARRGFPKEKISSVQAFHLPAGSGSYWIKIYISAEDEQPVYTELYYQDRNGFTFLDGYSGERLLDTDMLTERGVIISDGQYLYYSCGDGIVERIDRFGQVKSILDARVKPVEGVVFGKRYAELDFGYSDSGVYTEFSGAGEEFTAVMVYRHNKDNKEYRREDIYIIERDSMSVINSSKGEFKDIAQSGEDVIFGELDEYKGDDPSVEEFVTKLSPQMQQMQDELFANILENGDEDMKQVVRDGHLYYYVESVLTGASPSGDFWVKSYAQDMGQFTSHHEIYFRDENGFRLLAQEVGVGPQFLQGYVNGVECIFYLMNDGYIRCVDSDGNKKEFDFRESMPQDAVLYGTEDEVDYLWDSTITGKGSRVTAQIKKGYMSNTADDWCFATDIVVIDAVTLEVVSVSKGDYTAASASDAFEILPPTPHGENEWTTNDPLFRYKGVDYELGDTFFTSFKVLPDGTVYFSYNDYTELEEAVLNYKKLPYLGRCGTVSNGYTYFEYADMYLTDSGKLLGIWVEDGFTLYPEDAPEGRRYAAGLFVPAAESITHPMGEQYWFSGVDFEHTHPEASMDDHELFELGATMMEQAADILDILHGRGLRDMSAGREIDGELMYPYYSSYEQLEERCRNTFASDTEHIGALYTNYDPSADFNWINDENYQEYAGDTILNELKKSVKIVDGKAYCGNKAADGLYYDTSLVGVLYSTPTRISYQLCTTRVNDWTDPSSIEYEHSVMLLDKIDGKWLITKLRDDFGVGDTVYYLHGEEGQRNLDIMDAQFEAETGLYVKDSTMADIDFDGVYERVLLVPVANTQRLYIYENSRGHLFPDGYIEGNYAIRYLDSISGLTPYAGAEGELHYYSFTYDNGTMNAEVTAGLYLTGEADDPATPQNEKYSAMPIISKGTVTYSDIDSPYTDDFCRRGWRPTDVGMQDYGDITVREYNEIKEDLISGGRL